MFKKQPFIVFIFLCASYLGFGQASDLIISEYAEGSSNNKYIEIYNGTGTSVDLNDYEIWKVSNGGTWPEVIIGLSGNLVDGDVFIIANSSSNATILAEADLTMGSADWNGNDAVGLAKSGVLIDVIGTDGADPGTGWDVAGTANSTANHTLVRKNTICDPNTNWTISAGTNTTDSEWEVYSQDDWTYLGLHTAFCSSTDEVDWCDLQSPATGTITYGGVYNVYAQAYEPGVTDSAGQGAGIQAWIGYSTTNTNPNTWTDWVVASYNTDVGNNDEYVADIGSVIPTSGTYYYASRFQYNGGPYRYGGITPPNGGNFWDGSTYISGVLTVNPDQVDFCNVQYPKSYGITTGSSFYVYAQTYELGVTDSAGQGAGIQAWIGYNTIGENYQPWNVSGWTWIPASYNPSCLDCNSGANDEYFVDIGCGLPAGTYYYASRFQLNGSDYSYGGIQSDGNGNFWDGVTYISGDLTVTSPPLADVVITEIMYNSTGTDDEWIELCNVSGSTQDLSNYTIAVTGGNADGTVFTFPCDTTILNGNCITIDLGNGGVGVYNDDCTFTATYSNGFGTGTLGNTSGTITLKSANGTPADSVAYNNSDGGSPPNSLQVIDVSLDNSDTGYNWQEVGYGGSWGTNSLVPNCAPMVAEINVEGNLGSYPDIADGDTTPSGTDNTLFAAQYIGSSQSKSYRIQNLGGVDLTISSVTLTGDTGDFSITGNPSSPITYGTPSILEITFSPTAIGTRTAVVHIFNNDDNTDGDTEEEYTFTIQGDGLCATSSNTITPSSGPVGTIATVSGTNLSTATASFNGIPATVNHISDTEMEVTVPSGAVTGNLQIVDDQPCTSTIPFTVIDDQIGSCEGGLALSELFISEVTDATYGSLTYVEIYNATGVSVDLSNYAIGIYANGFTDVSHYTEQTLSGTLAPNSTYVLTMGVQPPLNGSLCSVSGGDGSLGVSSSLLFGINKKDNGHDFIGLYNSGVLVDAFGVFGDDDWMDTLHTTVTGDRGFDFRRLNMATPIPQTAFDDNDWIIIDWPGSGSTSCSTNDYSDIGVYDFSTGTPPAVDSGPTVSSSCNTATISVSGSEGYSSGKSLAYQWYYSAPGDLGWTAILNGGFYNNATTSTLDILDTSLLEGYQYYCQIREDDATCYTASDAVQLTLPTTTWTISGWSDGPPDINTIAIIDYNYNTSSDGNFSACNLIINSGATLDIKDNTYVQVENDAVINGSIKVRTRGAFVQVDDSGTFTLNSGGSAEVEKYTANLDAWYEYTYWSSPVIGETVEDAFPDTPSTRRFWFNAQNYKDSTKEIGNNNNTAPGQDDIDDNGDDWQIASGVMDAGVGYAATSSPLGMYPNAIDQAVFSGAFHTGDINVEIYRNDDELADNNWNFIGNPYPCAISADLLLMNNLAIDQHVPYKPEKAGFTEGAIFLWSQNSDPSSSNNGNENKNFSQNDYAIINLTDVIAGGDGVIPKRYIPSGQSFFIAYDDSAGGALITSPPDDPIYEGTVTFTNSMRVVDNNDQFFRSTSSKSSNRPNKLKINLTSDNGVFNQIAVGYVNGATKDYDGMAYDTPRNLSNPLYSSIYTMIEGIDKKFAIQGKAPNDLQLGEVLHLGFDTSIDVSTVYTLSLEKVEGEFLSLNPVYLKDNYMHTVHNLSESDYSFTSEVGEFKDRFEIGFQSEALSDTDVQLNSKNLTIIELNDGRVQFKTNNDLSIKSVKIMDVLGRTLYQLKGSGSSEIYNLSGLSQSAYIAKVELSNGQVITKRAIKRL